MKTPRTNTNGSGWLLVAGAGALVLGGSAMGGCELIVSPNPDLLNEGGGTPTSTTTTTTPTTTTGSTSTVTTASSSPQGTGGNTTSDGGGGNTTADGGGGSSSDGGGGTGGTSGTGDGGAGGGTGGAGGGTGGAPPECVDAEDDCPAPADCEVATCLLGECGSVDLVDGEACDLVGDDDGRCNSSGTCVECLDEGDCPTPAECQVAVCDVGACSTMDADDDTDCDGGTCQNGACDPFPICSNNVQDVGNGETDIDCGGDPAGQTACGRCAVDDFCILPRDCATSVCIGVPLTCELCTQKSDCPTDMFCDDAGVCQDEIDQGDACDEDEQCGTNFCVDDVCCENACADECETCGNANGTCEAAAAGTEEGTECPDVDCRTGTCGDSRACGLAAVNTQCGDDQSCTNGTQTNQDTCTALGVCTNNGTTPCGTYLCNGTAGCRTSCTADNQCATGNYCEGTSCVPTKPTGDPCTGGDGDQCQSGFCVDGFCCGDACGDLCEACSAALSNGANGTCSPVDTADTIGECANPTTNSECVTGACSGTGNTCGLQPLGGAPSPACPDNLQCDGGNDCPANCADNDLLCIAAEFCTGGGGDNCNADSDPGETCSRDAMCINNLCNETEGECQCTADNQCMADEFCDDVAATGLTLTCVDDGLPGEPCDENGDCVSADCNGGTTCGCSADGQCLPAQFCDDTATTGDTDTCVADRAVGLACGSGADCLSGSCVGSICRCVDDGDCAGNQFCDNTATTGNTDLCVADGGVGAACEDNADCINATCNGNDNCACLSDADCAGNQFCDDSAITGDTDDCVADRGTGGACDDNTDCTSNSCGVTTANQCDA